MTCDPSEIANSARCMNQCIPPGFQRAVTISLLCEIAQISHPDAGNFRITDLNDFRVTDTGDSRIWILWPVANKTINALSAGGALALTDEIERQITGGGASQKFTGAQLVALVEANAAAFAKTSVSFANTIVASVLNAASAVNVNSGAITLGAGGDIFANGQITIGAAVIILAPNGDVTAVGSLLVGGFITSPADIEVTDTASGFVLKSPNGTRYRIKVDDGGQLGTEAA